MGRTVRSLVAAGVAVLMLPVAATSTPGCWTGSSARAETPTSRPYLDSSVCKVIPVAAWASSRSGTLRVIVTTSGKPVRVDGLALGR